MSIAAYRVLLCGAPAQSIIGRSDQEQPPLEIVACPDEAGILPLLGEAQDGETPFDLVIIWASAHSPDPMGLAQLIAAADKHLGIVICNHAIVALPREPWNEHVIQLPAGVDPACLRDVAAAAARSARSARTLEATRRDHDVTHRAYRAVSSEFQRQNKRLAEQEQRLSVQNKMFDAALNNMSQGLCMFDAEARLLVCNERYINMYGLSPEIVKPGCTLHELLAHRREMGTFAGDPAEYCAELLARIAEGKTTSQIVELGDGRTIALVNQPMVEGGWVATHEDITERTRAEEQIKHMARHDALTNLPNRVAFRERMEQALTRVRRGEQHAILCLDLDHFKSVNDTLGHPTGDALLRVVTERLHRCVRELDTVARLGGDEFAILQVGITRPDHAGVLAQRVIAIVSEPYDIDGHHVVIGASVGIALAPHDGASPEQLLRNADMALYRAKADGRASYRFFEREMDAQLQARRSLELDLRKALNGNQFEVFYQPLVNAESEEITSCEALLRWRHPERGTVSPADFIPLAEEIGLIVPLGEWVLRQACAEAAGWPEHIRVAVNLSPAQFKNRSLVQTVMHALARSGLKANRLELEITESVLLHDNEATMATLHQLRELGIRISMDDFGTGYSSLSYLRSFPFDKIKIDRSFVRDLSEKADCAAIIKAVAGLGRGLGIITTAEGVETQAQLETVRAEGCTEVQGYLFSPPRPAAAVREFIAKHQKKREAA